MYTYNITEDTIYDEIIEQEGVDPLLPKMGLTVPCSYNEYISKKSELIVDRQTAENFRRTFCTRTLADMYNSHRRSFDTEYEFKIGSRVGYFREAVIITQDMETGDLWGLTYVRDVTGEHDQAKRVEQALRDAFDQAQHANSAKTLFMSQMSHDIRTPLNAILGMVHDSAGAHQRRRPGQRLPRKNTDLRTSAPGDNQQRPRPFGDRERKNHPCQ